VTELITNDDKEGLCKLLADMNLIIHPNEEGMTEDVAAALDGSYERLFIRLKQIIIMKKEILKYKRSGKFNYTEGEIMEKIFQLIFRRVGRNYSARLSQVDIESLAHSMGMSRPLARYGLQLLKDYDLIIEAPRGFVRLNV
jgi:hypothetical protein